MHSENRTATHWNVEDGYDANADTDTYPYRVLGSGSKAGLNLLLSGVEKDFDYLCRGTTQGFKVIICGKGIDNGSVCYIFSDFFFSWFYIPREKFPKLQNNFSAYHSVRKC